MSRQARDFMLQVLTKVNVYQLLALAFVIGSGALGMPTGGGGGA
jgi:hypothetical protein